MSVIRFEGVRKSLPHGFWLRRRDVLRDLSFSVNAGEVYGFLGPNGAGKTTSIKCVLGLLRPEAGSIELFGRPSDEPGARERLGYLPEQPYFYAHLTGRELVDYFGQLFCIPTAERRRRTDELIGLVGMADSAELPIRQYSKGMLQRIGLAQALINEPELVILDEPMSGLDPIGRREIKDIVEGLKARGTTVFFSSHILADAEALCDRVGLLYRGRLIREGALGEMLHTHVEYWEAACSGAAARALADFPEPSRQGDRLYFRFHDAEVLDRWVDAVRGAGGSVIRVAPHRTTLEDYFVRTLAEPTAGGAQERPVPEEAAS